MGQKQDQHFQNYKNMIFKFRRKLHSAAKNNALFPGIGDEEIEVSQRIADKLRASATVPDALKSKVTSIHHSFVKFVWNL